MYVIDDKNNITMIRGDTVELDIIVNEIDAQGNITEYTPQEGDVLTFTVKKTTKTADVLIQKNGVHIVILPEDTQNLDYKTYKYDVQLTMADGTVDTIIPPCDFIVEAEVTW